MVECWRGAGPKSGLLLLCVQPPHGSLLSADLELVCARLVPLVGGPFSAPGPETVRSALNISSRHPTGIRISKECLWMLGYALGARSLGVRVRLVGDAKEIGAVRLVPWWPGVSLGSQACSKARSWRQFLSWRATKKQATSVLA